MFYVKNVVGNSVEVCDTVDNIVETYTLSEILEIGRQVRIKGVTEKSVAPFDLQVYINARMAKDKMHGIETTYDFTGDGDIILTAFSGDVTQYSVLAGTRVIDKLAFYRQESLKKIVMKDVTLVGYQCFGHCENLEFVDAPNLEKIGDNLFSECKSLKRFDFPRLHTVGTLFMNDCVSLSYVNLKNIISDGQCSLYGCPLEIVILPDRTVDLSDILSEQVCRNTLKELHNLSKYRVNLSDQFLNDMRENSGLKIYPADEDTWVLLKEKLQGGKCHVMRRRKF